MNTTISEALATGLPVIATKHSGFPDQVKHGVNGYLANEADPNDIAAKMREYLAHPERWRAMSAAAREHALQNYDRGVLIQKQVELYERLVPGAKKLALFVGIFPAFSETFIINQVADLIDRGIDVQIYALQRGSTDNISDRYYEYGMEKRLHLLEMPTSKKERFRIALPLIIKLLFIRPLVLCRTLNIFRYKHNALSLKLLFRVAPLINIQADIVHCHFGPVAMRYLVLGEIVGEKLSRTPLVTSFHGFDVSRVPKEKGIEYYHPLRSLGDAFIVHSQNMKERVAKLGFNIDKIEIIPTSIDVEGFPFVRREAPKDGVPIRIVSVGRFVEKKGFDDILRATAILKRDAPRPFHLHIIGGGVLENELRTLARELDIENLVTFEGLMKVQDVVKFLTTAHLFVQTSKTAKNGDME